MLKNKAFIVLLTTALLSLFLSALEVDVTGDWQMTMETPRGEITSDVHFDQEGERLTVTMVGPEGDEISGEGTVKGSEIEWTVTRSTPRGEMTMTYTGTVEGNKMSGEVQFGDFGSARWEATRI